MVLPAMLVHAGGFHHGGDCRLTQPALADPAVQRLLHPSALDVCLFTIDKVVSHVL